MWLTKELQKFCNNYICRNKKISQLFFSLQCLPIFQTLWYCLFVFFPPRKVVFFAYTVSFSSSLTCLSPGHSHLTLNVVLELFNCIMKAIKMKQSGRIGCKSKRSGKNHTRLILLLFKITIKDNGYVSRQLDQQCEEKKMQYRKAFQFKAIVKKKRKNSLC